jgi:hypothetical protein
MVGRNGAEQHRLHVPVLRQAIEGFLRHGQLWGPAAARRGPAQPHDPVGGLELFKLVGAASPARDSEWMHFITLA